MSDGKRPSREIAEALGLTPRYVRKVQLRRDLPRLNEGARQGCDNHQFVSGRRIDLDGYVLVTAPSDHPYARQRTNRDTKLITEHRLVLEKKLGRYLLPEEVVDHIDGLTLHNAPENLRLFDANRDHLQQTLTGRRPMWSPRGFQNFFHARWRPTDNPLVDMYAERRARGEIRLRQILLAALKLGTDSPFLSGTTHHTTKAGIDMSSRSTIERALADLYRQWGWHPTQ
jgi:hypothetical protein